VRDLPVRLDAFQKVKTGADPVDRMQDNLANTLRGLTQGALFAVKDITTTGASQRVDFGVRWAACWPSVGGAYVQVKQLSRDDTSVTIQASVAGVALSMIAIF
jgi:hypothetical protein